MLQSLKRLFVPDTVKQAAHDAYVAIVAQSRQPVFYSDWQVEDTIDGRFDMILLHLALIMGRCEAEPDFCRQLAEVFFADMDRSLREMGASDTGVGKRVQKMAQAFYGRLNAYEEARGNTPQMVEALKRNIYRERPVDDATATALAEYMQRNAQLLLAQPVDAIMRGAIAFSG